jgi:hypothetical protein
MGNSILVSLCSKLPSIMMNEFKPTFISLPKLPTKLNNNKSCTSFAVMMGTVDKKA